MEYMLIELLSALSCCDIAFFDSGKYIDHHFRHLRAIDVVNVVYACLTYAFCVLSVINTVSHFLSTLLSY